MAAVLFSCTKPNPLYCDENTDCANGSFCNLDTHGCDLLAVDAATDGAPIDTAPFVARTIAEIRMPSTPVGTPVELSGVVVTAVDRYGVRKGEFWVQTSGGGSGVKIYGALAADVMNLSAGDVVDISNAQKSRFFAAGDTTGRAEIEVIAALGGSIGITKKGTSQSPIATSVNAGTIATLQQPQYDEAREALAGSLVVVNQQKAMGPPQLVSGDATFLEFSIGPFEVTSAQAALPTGIINQTCFSSIRGVVSYTLEYELIPPQTSDVTIGTGCP